MKSISTQTCIRYTCSTYAFNPANINIAMQIVAPIAHTLNRSGAWSGASFSVPDCHMYTYV